MLDSDTTDSTSNDSSPDTASDAAPSTAAPRKRAPRKRAASKSTAETSPDQPVAQAEPAQTGEEERPAPRKRAPRRASRAADATAPDAPAPEAPAPEAPSADSTAAADGQPPSTRPRKRAAKKAPTPPASEQTPATPASVDIEAAPAPPAKKATRKRAAKKVAEPAVDAAAAAAPESPTSPPAAPTVQFQAPAADESGTPRRRRSARKAAGPAASDERQTSEPQPADADIAVAEDAEDQTAEPEDVREIASEQASGARRRRRRRRGRGGGSRKPEAEETTDNEPDAADDDKSDDDAPEAESDGEEASASTRRRRRRRRAGGAGGGDGAESDSSDPQNTVVHVREKRSEDDGVRAVKGSTRLEAKRQRRRDGRETTRRRAPILTEAEFLARRESVDRVMAVRQNGERTQIAVLEDGVLVEHYVTRASATSYVGNVYLGRVQNVLPSMEAAFIDIGKGRNGVLYAGEVNWDAAGLEGKARAIEQAMKSGDAVLVQVTKDPIGHKGARLTSQISLPGRYLVYVPGGGMTGISRRLPDTERHRLKTILRKIVPDEAGVIVRTAAEGASEEDLSHDVERLRAQWEAIEKKAKQTKNAPMLVHGEPDLATRVVRDVFNEDFKQLVVQGDGAWDTVSQYVSDVAPELAERVSKHVDPEDIFAKLRVDEQLMKALDRKVWLPSGGSLIIDRTEAMTVIDVNTGKFVGAGGNLEQTVTRNNLEAAEEIARQLRLRDVGGIVVIDFIDMVLESNRDLVLRRLVECLGRDRTKHQVAEVTSLGLVQMTRKRVGEGLLEAFSEPCEVCHGRGVLVHTEPVDRQTQPAAEEEKPKSRRKRGGRGQGETDEPPVPAASAEQRQAASAAIAAIHRAASGEQTATDGDEATDRVDELASGLVAAALQAGQPDSDQRPATADAVDAVAAVEAPEQAGTDGRSGARRRRRAASRPAGPPVPAAG